MNQQDQRAIAYLTKRTREQHQNANPWDLPGITAAIEKVANLPIHEVTAAALRAANDPNLDTPTAIGNTHSSYWRNTPPAPPVHGPAGVTHAKDKPCGTCGKPETSSLHPVDHAYEHPAKLRAAVASQRRNRHANRTWKASQ